MVFIIGVYSIGNTIIQKRVIQETNQVKQEFEVLLEEKNEENKQLQKVVDEYKQELEELHDEFTQLKEHSQESEKDESRLELVTGSKETIMRQIEGMDQEIQVYNYEIAPYGIHYQFDESFGIPEINQNRVIYSSHSTVSFEVFEHINLEQIVSDLQKSFERDGYEDKGELENTPLEENDLRGKMQFFTYPVKGFYAYQINEHVLVITYQYPGEAGDGMFPLLESLRKSIRVD